MEGGGELGPFYVFLAKSNLTVVNAIHSGRLLFIACDRRKSIYARKISLGWQHVSYLDIFRVSLEPTNQIYS